MTSALRWMLRGCLVGAALFGPLWRCPLAMARVTTAASSRLPAIKQVAIMPVYWQGQFPDSNAFTQHRPHIEQDFTRIARASKRFNFTNDVITADLWANPEGRKELAEEYEIDGLLNLTVTAQSDLMLWTVRLLSPSLENLLSETERVPYAWFLAAGPAEIEQRLQTLVYRLLNRYPIDVFVTSVQGRYVSLSAGLEQNVFEGDELSFYLTTLKSRHPVDSSWLGFEQKLLGKARIIESKSQSSIALITSLSYENAIGAGDGARVEGIASRRPFHQPKVEEQRYLPVDKDSALVEAVGEWKEPIAPAPPPPIAVKPTPQPKPTTYADNAPVVAPLPAAVEPPQSAEVGTPPADSESSLDSILPFSFKQANYSITSENLHFGGSAKMTSEAPAYFVNRLTAQGVHEINSDWEGWYSATIRKGDSGKGDYYGVGGQVEALYKFETLSNQVPSLSRIMAGGLLRLETIAADGETFGGWDGFFLGPTIHLQGSRHLADIVQTIDYDIAVRYLLSAWGSAGIAGKKRDFGPGSSLELNVGAYFRGSPEDIEWGGGLVIANGSWSLSKGSIREQVLGLELLLRKNL